MPNIKPSRIDWRLFLCHLYRWLSQYRAVSSIIVLWIKRGWSENSDKVRAKQEEVIERVINAFYLNK